MTPRARAPQQNDPEPEQPKITDRRAAHQPVPAAELPNVHQAMADAMGRVRAVGKNGVNKEQGYTFRSIDDFMSALNPAMAAAGVHIVPNVLQRFVDSSGKTRSGAIIRRVEMEVQFTIYGPRGDSFTCVMWGEANDSADKATNKAATAAYKYALMELFTVPTSDVQDADRDHVEVEQRPEPEPEAPLDPDVVATYRERFTDAASRPERDRRSLIAKAWKDAQLQDKRILPSVVDVPELWREVLGNEVMALGALGQAIVDNEDVLPSLTAEPDDGADGAPEMTGMQALAAQLGAHPAGGGA
jgi:hypothetical protein